MKRSIAVEALRSVPVLERSIDRTLDSLEAHGMVWDSEPQDMQLLLHSKDEEIERLNREIADLKMELAEKP